jgi:hypothetical protein
MKEDTTFPSVIIPVATPEVFLEAQYREEYGM